jgi:hypothetical protein
VTKANGACTIGKTDVLEQDIKVPEPCAHRIVKALDDYSWLCMQCKRTVHWGNPDDEGRQRLRTLGTPATPRASFAGDGDVLKEAPDAVVSAPDVTERLEAKAQDIADRYGYPNLDDVQQHLEGGELLARMREETEALCGTISEWRRLVEQHPDVYPAIPPDVEGLFTSMQRWESRMRVEAQLQREEYPKWRS